MLKVWGWCRGYWRDVRNVKQELQRWLKGHPLEGPHLLPSQSQLRRTGDSSLAVAITKHGGYKKLFAEYAAHCFCLLLFCTCVQCCAMKASNC